MEQTFFGLEKPILIAGPCAAESAEMLWQTARALKAGAKVGMFRCGSWKVRSKPGDFEGMGEAALPVLQQIQRELDFPVCIEVATPVQVELAQQYGIRCCWIGARTTVNPLLVAEIAEAMRGSGMAVMVKNPMVPDLKLWEGAFERLQRADIKEVAAVYRGFSTAESAPYRNQPLWHLAIEWKRRFPELPFICDPSHIAGRREWIAELAQKALYLDADGLMLEVHPHPETARSDAAQQLSVEAFSQLVSGLYFPQSPANVGVLDAYRTAIDELDAELLSLLSRRMDVSRRIARVKKEQQLPLLQLDRWQEVLSDALRRSAALQLDADFVERLMNLIHEASINAQEKELK